MFHRVMFLLCECAKVVYLANNRISKNATVPVDKPKRNEAGVSPQRTATPRHDDDDERARARRPGNESSASTSRLRGRCESYTARNLIVCVYYIIYDEMLCTAKSGIYYVLFVCAFGLRSPIVLCIAEYIQNAYGFLEWGRTRSQLHTTIEKGELRRCTSKRIGAFVQRK